MNSVRNLFTALTLGSFLFGSAISEKTRADNREVRVYSGRHYNTDREIYKKFAEETGIRVRLIESTGISLIERLRREGSKSNADVILLVDAARISNAAKEGLLQSYRSIKLDKDHFTINLDKITRICGGQFTFYDAIFTGLDDHYFNNVDYIFHGHGLDYFFQGMYLPTEY